MKIVIIVPTYNESKAIKKTIDTLLEDIVYKQKNDQYHIMISDSRSPDSTYQLVVDTYRENDRVIPILEKGQKLGIGHAYREAIKLAFNEYNADAIVTFDADLSHDHRIIPMMAENIKRGDDAVIGTRYRKGGGIPSNWGLHRKLLSIFGNYFVNIMFFEFNQTDYTSGFRMVNKKILNLLDNDAKYLNGYTFSVYINLLPSINNFKVSEVAYKFVDREVGESKMPATYIKDAFLFIIKMRLELLFERYKVVKALIAGGIGTLCHLLSYFWIFRPIIENQNLLGLNKRIDISNVMGLSLDWYVYPRYLIAVLFAIEIGIFFTFIINNNWTFKENSFRSGSFLKNYFHVHLVALLPIMIQMSVATFSVYLFGRGLLRDGIYQLMGIALGFIVSFYLYKNIIWKSHD